MPKKFLLLFVTILFLILLFLLIFRIKKLGYRVTYQTTSSMPKGFYFVKSTQKLYRKEIVVFHPPKRFLVFAQEHHWIPRSGWLMKYIAAIPGDYVCKRDGFVWINHHKIARVYRYYAPHKRLPSQYFCYRLKQHQYLLLSTRVAHSFDGRYFGPINQHAILGQATKFGVRPLL